MEDQRSQQIIQFLNGKLSEIEQTELSNWRAASTENEKQYQEIKFLWEKASLAHKTKQEVTIDVEAALAKVNKKLPTPTKVIDLRQRILRLAMVASVLLLIGIFWISYQQASTEILVVTAGEGETKKVLLADNSIVWLNEKSTLSYPKFFEGSTRTIEMEGDAVFEVTHNKQQPFIVKSNDLMVKVLGTKFNVLSDNNRNTNSKVHVIDGKVEVRKKETEEGKVVLTKGMSANLESETNHLSVANVSTANQLFWYHKTLVFENSKLEKVFSELETAYAIDLEIENTDLLQCSFNGGFKDKTISEVLNLLQLIYQFDLDEKDINKPKIINGTCN